MLLDDMIEMFAHDAASGAPENISNKKNAQMQNPKDRISNCYSL